jgi:hypothetical protein
MSGIELPMLVTIHFEEVFDIQMKFGSYFLN